MSEYDVMKLAGHSDFRTTHKYYLVVKADLVDRQGYTMYMGNPRGN